MGRRCRSKDAFARVLLLSLGGCGEGPVRPEAGLPPLRFDDAGAAVSPAASSVRRSSAEHRFDIAIDYRFDTQGYFTDDKRRLLEAAANAWEVRLLDDFAAIPAGTPLRVKNLEMLDGAAVTVELDEPIDDLLLFVACSHDLDQERVNAQTRSTVLFTSVWGPEFQSELEVRWQGPDREPWAIGISFGCEAPFFFDPTPETHDDLPNDAQDFLRTAMHEMGHALGVGSSPAYQAWMRQPGPVFTGPRVSELFGGPLPLEADGHVASQLLFENQRVLMDPAAAPRQRDTVSRLDLALLEDIGYEIAPAYR